MTKMVEVQEAASALPESERAELAAFLLESLDKNHHWVDDEEVTRRFNELESGEVKGLTRDEFNHACGH